MLLNLFNPKTEGFVFIEADMCAYVSDRVLCIWQNMNVFWCINPKIKNRPYGSAKCSECLLLSAKDFRITGNDLMCDFSK